MRETEILPTLRDELLSSLGTVGDAMTTDVVTLRPDVPVADALMLLERAGVAGGPVIEHEQVIGVVTTRDLVQRGGHAQTTGPFLRPPRGQTEWCVRDVMTRGVVIARQEWPLLDAIDVMDQARVNRLPVVDAAGRPVGILARDDVIRALARVARAGEREPLIDFRPLLPPD